MVGSRGRRVMMMVVMVVPVPAAAVVVVIIAPTVQIISRPQESVVNELLKSAVDM